MKYRKKAAAWLLAFVLCVPSGFAGAGMETVHAEGATDSTVYNADDGWIYTYGNFETDAPYVTILGYDYDIGKTTDLDIPVKVVNFDNNTDKYVTAIMSSAFYKDTNVTSVAIPQSVVDIGEMSFSGCTSLKTVTMSDGMVVSDSSIGLADSAFSGCTSLESVELPDGIAGIGSQAFSGCRNLKSIKLPLAAAQIKEKAFYNCSSLERVDIPGGVEKIGDYAFSGCSSLETLVFLNNDLKTIGAYAFSGCSSLVGVVIPEYVTGIGKHAFDNCTSLESIVIPASVTELGSVEENVFTACPDVTIYTTSGSTAESMAKAWGINVVLMEEESDKASIPTVAKVTNFKATADANELNLSWKKSAEADGYQIQVSTKKGFGNARILDFNQSDVKFTKTGLKSNTTYYARIRAYKLYEDENGQSQFAYGKWTTISKKTAKAPTVASVKSFKAAAKSKSLVLSWKKLSRADGYQIQVSAKKSFKGAKKITVKKSKVKYTALKLKSKTKYYVRIRAYRNYKNEKGNPQKAYGKWVTLNCKTKKEKNT